MWGQLKGHGVPPLEGCSRRGGLDKACRSLAGSILWRDGGEGQSQVRLSIGSCDVYTGGSTQHHARVLNTYLKITKNVGDQFFQ